MQRKPVESSQILSVGYDPKTQVLEIQFKRNLAIYSYSGVPLNVANDLVRSGSVGKFFNAYVKNVYPFVKQETLTDGVTSRS